MFLALKAISKIAFHVGYNVYMRSKGYASKDHNPWYEAGRIAGDFPSNHVVVSVFRFEPVTQRQQTNEVIEKPTWACRRYGDYEHDWLSCYECLEAYEK